MQFLKLGTERVKQYDLWNEKEILEDVQLYMR